MKVSIIVPVYNAAATLQRTLDSIAAQTVQDFELVFVDDRSTDGSREIMEAFASGSGIECQILTQEANGGVAAARNRGLDAARGEYIAWVDADDLISPKTLELALSAAESRDADIVGWDWTLGFDRNGRYMRQADYEQPVDALKALMGGTMRWNLWLFLTRRSLVEDNAIRFIPGANMGEDMMFMIRAFAAARTVAQLHESLYSYNAVSGSSISRQFSEQRRAEVTLNVRAVERSILDSAYAGQLKEYINYLKLYIKLPLIISASQADYDVWYGWFSDVNHYAAANKALPLRTRAVQWMAARRCWLGVRLYYLLVYKFVYGIIYR